MVDQEIIKRVVTALAEKLDVTEPVEQVISAEDLFPGYVALLRDFAVHLEERLGKLEIKGEYFYADAGEPSVREGIGGVVLTVAVGEETLRLNRLAPVDAQTILRRFGGDPSSLTTPGPETDEAPPAPQPSTVETPARTTPVAFRWGGLVTAAVLIAAALLAIDLLLLAIESTLWGYPRLGSAIGWLTFAAAGPIAARRAELLGPVIGWGLAAAAMGLVASLLLPMFGAMPVLFWVIGIAGSALVSVGWFRARKSRHSWKIAAGLGAGFAVARLILIRPLTNVLLVPMLSSIDGDLFGTPIYVVGFYIVGAIAGGVFWLVQYAAEALARLTLEGGNVTHDDDERDDEMLASIGGGTPSGDFKVGDGDDEEMLASIGGGTPSGDFAVDQDAAPEEPLASIGGDTPAVPMSGAPPAATERESDLVTPECPERYTVKKEAGRGGIGRVLIGFDAHLGRDVAIKELLTEHLTSGSAAESASSTAFMERFLREARVTGQLEHPSIIPVYELGRREDGVLYYTMKLVRGRTLAAALDDCDSLDERLGLLGHFHNLCQAVAYAHSRGVIHRDIKPENVMVGEFGETVVLDWGLAKVRGKEDIRSRSLARDIELLTKETSETIAGHAMGTPAYMSPEQAEGDVDAIDQQSDVWGLGAVLYEILTGGPPFTGKSPYEIVGKVMREPVTPVRQADPKTPQELAAIAEKALTRDKGERYFSATEIAEELDAFRSGARVEAHHYTALDLLKRLISHNKPAVAVAAVFLLILGIFVAGAYSRVIDERDLAIKAERRSHRHLGQALAEKARSAAKNGDWMGADVYASAALDRQETPETRGLLLSLDTGWRPRLSWEKTGGTACAKAVVSPNGKVVACPTMMAVVLYDLRTGKETARLMNPSGWLTSAAFSPDGRYIAAGGKDKMVAVWDLTTGNLRQRFAGHTAEVHAVAFSSAGGAIASASQDKTVKVWRFDARAPIATLTGHAHEVLSLAYSPVGNLLASADEDGRIRLWPVVDGAPVGKKRARVLSARKEAISDLRFNDDGTLLATASDDQTVRIWDVGAGVVSLVLAGHGGAVSTVAFSADGRHVVSGGADATVRAWNIHTGRRLGLFEAHAEPVWSVGLSPKGNTLVTASADKRLRTWSLDPIAMPHKLTGSQDKLHALALSPDKLLVAAAGADFTIYIWERQSGRQIANLRGHSDRVSGLAFHPSGRVLASSSHDQSVILWNLETDKPDITLTPHGQKVRAVAISPDGKRLATGGDDRMIQVFDLEKEGASVSLRGHEALVTSVAFSRSSKLLASGGWDRTVRIWDLESGEQRHELTGHTENVYGVAFLPAEDGVVSVSGDETTRLWRLRDGSEIGKLTGHGAPVLAVAVDDTGEIVATAGHDKTVRLWNLKTSREVARFDAHTEAVSALAFALDGSFLVSASRDKTVRLWSLGRLRVDRRQLLPSAQQRYGLAVDGIQAVPDDDWQPPY